MTKTIQELQRKVQAGTRTRSILNWTNPKDRVLLEQSAFAASVKNDPKRRIKSRLSVSW